LPPDELPLLVRLLDQFLRALDAAAIVWADGQAHKDGRFGEALVPLSSARLPLLAKCPSLPEKWTRPPQSGLLPQAGATAEEWCADLRDFRNFVVQQTGRRTARKRHAPPLSDREQEVLDLIASHPPGAAIPGKAITRHTGVCQSTLTSHIIPKLKRWYGVKNRRGAGYYLDKSQ
jgi:hypothetical protein